MNRMRSMYVAMLGMALAGANINTRPGKSSSEVNVTPKTSPIPKGCKEYYFSSTGEMYEENNEACEFKCIALNEKSARKKFEKYISTQIKKD